MKPHNTDKDFQDRCFQQLQAMEAQHRISVVENFVIAAKQAGYSVDDLLKLMDEGTDLVELSLLIASKHRNAEGG